MGQKVAELLEEKCKVLETLSECEHKVGEEQIVVLAAALYHTCSPGFKGF